MKIIKTKNLPRPFWDTALNKNNVKQYHINREQSVYLSFSVYFVRISEFEKNGIIPGWIHRPSLQPYKSLTHLVCTKFNTWMFGLCRMCQVLHQREPHLSSLQSNYIFRIEWENNVLHIPYIWIHFWRC